MLWSCTDDWPEKRIMRRLFILREVAATFFKVFSSLLEMKSLVYHLFQNRKVQSMQLDTYMIKAVRGCLILTTHRFYLLAASCRLGTSMIVYRLVWPFLQKHLCNICASSELWILMNWTCPICIPMCVVYQRQHLFQEFAHISCQVVTGSRKVSGKMPVATFTGVTLTSFTPLLLTRCKRGLRFYLCKGSSW